MYTYTYAMERGHSITGTVGQRLDGIYYIIDETMIFGPYLTKPDLQIPIADSDVVIDTNSMPFFAENLGGSSYVANELWSKDENDFTDEDWDRINIVHEITEQGMKDSCLYALSALSDAVAGYVAAIEYHVIATDYSAAIEYCVNHQSLVYYPERTLNHK